ncbi:MAG: hypothetical protein M3Y35_07025 [Actinomycetota bacterium]|nr:hypothetical protein [Actinomycetota bacterium]
MAIGGPWARVTPPWAALPEVPDVAAPDVAAPDADGFMLAAGPLEAAGGALEAEGLLPAADVVAGTDGLELEFAAVLPLPQADVTRARMPTAATPVIDFRNMKTSREWSASVPTGQDDHNISCSPAAFGRDPSAQLHHPFRMTAFVVDSDALWRRRPRRWGPLRGDLSGCAGRHPSARSHRTSPPTGTS